MLVDVGANETADYERVGLTLMGVMAGTSDVILTDDRFLFFFITFFLFCPSFLRYRLLPVSCIFFFAQLPTESDNSARWMKGRAIRDREKIEPKRQKKRWKGQQQQQQQQQHPRERKKIKTR